MTAAIINFKDLSGLERKTLEKIALATSRDIDGGADKRALLERIMRAIADKTVVSGDYRRTRPLRQKKPPSRDVSGLASSIALFLFVAAVIMWGGILGG